jgi:hypothetical protein
MCRQSVLVCCVILGCFATSYEPVRAQQIFIVCHGEFEAVCKQHPYTVFEHCGDDNHVGGADPPVTARSLCGNDKGEFASIAPGIGGNHCGYSWFRITCR